MLKFKKQASKYISIQKKASNGSFFFTRKLKNKMGILSIGKDPHPTFRLPWFPEASSYRYCDWLTRMSYPIHSSRFPLIRCHSASFSGTSLSEITSGFCDSCGICIHRTLTASAVALTGSRFHMSFFQKWSFISYLMYQIYYCKIKKSNFSHQALLTNY